MNTDFTGIKSSLSDIMDTLINVRAMLIIIAVILVAYLLVKILSRSSGIIAKTVIRVSDKSGMGDKATSYKRVETWIDVGMAIAKILIILTAFYVAWRLISPSNAPVAVIGAGAFFVVLAGGTVGPLLRDYTVGSMMIAEKWYGVGDFIKVEPFSDVQGVVEQLTLRSTKIRGLSGEVIWVHNQNIQAVRVKYRGVSTVAIDVFVRDKEKALELLNGIIDIVPKGPMLVVGGLDITDVEQLNDKMWRIEMAGKTVPGREWLVEKFAVEAITNADSQNNGDEKIIVHGPITRYIDLAAEKRFKRSLK